MSLPKNDSPYYNTTSNSSIQDQIRAMQGEAEWRGITDTGDTAGLAALNAYQEAEGANTTAARDLPVALKVRVADFTRRCGRVAGAGVGLRQGVLPTPRTQADLAASIYVRQFQYNSGLVAASFAAHADIVQNALTGAEQEAAAILTAVYDATAPACPKLTRSLDVDDAAADIRAALQGAGFASAGHAASNLLRVALATNDLLTLHVLLGTRSARILTAFSVNRGALLRTYADAQIAAGAAGAPDANGVTPLGQNMPAAAFLRLQTTDLRLANLPALAERVYTVMLAAAQKLLASAVVQANIS